MHSLELGLLVYREREIKHGWIWPSSSWTQFRMVTMTQYTGEKNVLFCKSGLIKMYRGTKQDIFPCSASPAQYILRSHNTLWYRSNTLHLCYLVLQSLCGRWCTPTLEISSSRQSHNKIKSLHATHYNMAISSTENKGCKPNHSLTYL